MLGYEAYISGNFDNSIIDNSDSRTSLAASKQNPERFEELNSGLPLTTAKFAVRHAVFGELGLSYMGGVYNKFTEDGLTIDNKRRLDVLAIDYNTIIPKLKTYIFAEWALVLVDVPDSYTQIYGNKQYGGFIDIVQPIISKPMFGWNKATLNLACRLEYVDWNVGTFKETGGNISEDIWSVCPAISFGQTPQTVLRFNYRYQQQKDLIGNPPARTGTYQLGFSTYF